MNQTVSTRAVMFLLTLALLQGCGGGGGSDDDDLPSFSPDVTLAARTAAATATAANSAACAAIEPFYWEIGDRSNRITEGTEGGAFPYSQTLMRIASASKWLFGAYAVELRDGVLTADDIQALTMQSGYTNLRYRLCVHDNALQQDALTVQDCFEAAALGSANNDFAADEVGKFFYNGGHYQRWAVQNGLGSRANGTLALAMRDQLGIDVNVEFDTPQLAGGAYMNADDYGFFLRKILSDDLRMGGLLGAQAVCASVGGCAAGTVSSSPAPAGEVWHYSLGHWVEDDPVAGDGAFSSAGYFGFYPWIDAGKQWYGIVAREVVPATLQDVLDNATAQESMECGRRIRRAWMSGQTQG